MPRTTILASDPRYPASFALLEDPPPALRVEGEPGAVDPSKSIAVVGTRAATADAREFARTLARDLAGAGATIVSGGALGIDRAAHEGALAAGGRTIVVIAGGLDQAGPPSNRPLFGKVVERGGALLSEHPDAQPPFASHFLTRNRLIAALVEAVVVVQAPARSGALSTARHAERLGKRLFAVPHFPFDSNGYGCNQLLRRGAGVCTSAQDVLLVSSFIGGLAAARPQFDNPGRLDELAADERTILEKLGGRTRAVDELARATGLPVARLHESLLLLELDGWVIEAGGGRYRRKRT